MGQKDAIGSINSLSVFTNQQCIDPDFIPGNGLVVVSLFTSLYFAGESTMEGLIVIAIVFYGFTKDIFKKPPQPDQTVDEQLGEAIAAYLKEGFKTRS